MPVPLHLGHGSHLITPPSCVAALTITFWQSGQIIQVLPLHEFRCLDGEFIQLGIQLLADFAPTSNEKLHRLTSLRVKAYRKVKVLRAGIDAGSPCGKLRCHDGYFKAAACHDLYATCVHLLTTFSAERPIT